LKIETKDLRKETKKSNKKMKIVMEILASTRSNSARLTSNYE